MSKAVRPSSAEAPSESREIKLPGLEHEITIAPSDDHVVVRSGRTTIADSRSTLVLRETNYAPVRYIPLADVDLSLLTRSDRTTYCPYKGDASYYSIPAEHAAEALSARSGSTSSRTPQSRRSRISSRSTPIASTSRSASPPGLSGEGRCSDTDRRALTRVKRRRRLCPRSLSRPRREPPCAPDGLPSPQRPSRRNSSIHRSGNELTCLSSSMLCHSPSASTFLTLSDVRHPQPPISSPIVPKLQNGGMWAALGRHYNLV